MAETAQQYVQRIVGYLQGRDPLQIMEETQNALPALVRGIPEARLHQSPAPDKWSVAEILAHLADVEVVVGYRVRVMLENSGSAIQGYDQNKWADLGRYNEIPTPESLERIRAQRQGNLRLLRSLTPEQWERYGEHSERGRESVAQTVRLWAGHDLNHRAQIENLLAASAKAS